MDKFVIRLNKRKNEENENEIHGKLQRPSTSTQAIQQNEVEVIEHNEEVEGQQLLPTSSDSSEGEISENNENNSETQVLNKVKKKSYKQHFKNSWVNQFSEWITRSEKNEAYCKICYKVIHGGITHMERHDSSTGHQRRLVTAKTTPKINTVLANSQEKQFYMTVKASELKCVMFIAEHNLPFAILDHLPKFIRNVCPDSKIAAKIKCGRKKGTQLCLKIIAPEQSSILSKKLNEHFFSVIIDETTDVSVTKCLVVVVRFAGKFKVKDKFLGLTEVKDGTAQSLFDAVINLLKINSINLENMLGFAADNATVMQGNRSGVQAKFKEVLPHIFVMGCVCHSIHLCAAAASAQLPNDLNDFCRDLCVYFAHSSSRNIRLKEFQEFCELETHKMLKLSNTRWLALQAVINRILEQWNALTLFFTDEVSNANKDGIVKANFLLQALRKPKNKLYLYFLNYILDLVNKLNLEFQSQSLRLHVLLKHISAVYKTILKNFIKPDVVENSELNTIDINPRNYLPIDQMYFGANTEMFILDNNNINPSDLHAFKINALKFYVELVSQIKSRINFNDEVLNFVQVLDPEVVFSEKFSSLVPIVKRFPMLCSSSDMELLNSEWRLLREHIKFKNLDLNAEEFWAKVIQTKNQINEIMFPLLKVFVNGLMCLAHSSAAAERIFSQVNLIKTKTRNRLKIETVNGLLHTKEMIHTFNCFTFEPSLSLLQRNINEKEPLDENDLLTF